MGSVSVKPAATSIVYFDSEGRQNLGDVLRTIKRQLRKREDLRALKLVIFTSEGQGPAMAYTKLREFKTKLIAVTFPLDFSVAKPNSNERFFPRIGDEIRAFFSGVRIEVVVPPRLPFDLIDGLDGHNQQVDLVRNTIAMFGSGFGQCIQAVICACDVGLVSEGEAVVAMSGDTAGLFIASSSRHFLNNVTGLQVQEIFCKPRRFTISKAIQKRMATPEDSKFLEGQVSSQG